MAMSSRPRLIDSATPRHGERFLNVRIAVQDERDQLRGLVVEFVEVESGKRNDRPQLALALAATKKAKATLIIAR
jgi:hypothetical protein